MANHVYTHLEIEFANQEDSAKFSKWIGNTIDENITWSAVDKILIIISFKHIQLCFS